MITSPVRRIVMLCSGVAVLVITATVYATATWNTSTATEEVGGDVKVGTGTTGWQASVSLAFDTNSPDNAVGSEVGSADITITSALYGDFSLTNIPLKLITASPVGCSGVWAAALDTGTPFVAMDKTPGGVPLWDDGPSGAGNWTLTKWQLDSPSYVCIQDAGANKRIYLTTNFSNQLGGLWGTSGPGTESLANQVSGFRWTGVASSVGKTTTTNWQNAANAQGGVTGLGSGTYLAVGGSPKAQLRDTVRKNVYRITKDLSPITPPVLPSLISINSLAGADPRTGILLYDFTNQPDNTNAIEGNSGRTVELVTTASPTDGVGAMSISGLKTVIIKGGNLKISSDLYYADPNSLVVFVVLKDENNPQNGGNVYVDPKVTNLVGTFVLDGSLLNLEGTTVLSSKTNSNKLRRQLLLYGSLASANTIGGSQGSSFVCPYGSDAERQGKTCSVVEAGKYDLSAFRTFYLGTSRKLDSMSVTSGAPSSAIACATASGAIAYDTPRWSQSNTWDALLYAWAGKRKCWENNLPALNLRTASTGASMAAFVAEFNPAALTADMPILQESSWWSP